MVYYSICASLTVDCGFVVDAGLKLWHPWVPTWDAKLLSCQHQRMSKHHRACNARQPHPLSWGPVIYLEVRSVYTVVGIVSCYL